MNKVVLIIIQLLYKSIITIILQILIIEEREIYIIRKFKN